MKKKWIYIAIVLGVAGVMNIIAHCCTIRYDMTDDKRYSLSTATKQLVQSLEDELTIRLYLDGELNSGFQRLRDAAQDLVEELEAVSSKGTIRMVGFDGEDLEELGLSPILIHERAKDGRTAQTEVYPYMQLTYKGRSTIIHLLRNNRAQSGEENIRQSIETLEFQIAEAIVALTRTQIKKIAFLEGHQELPEQNVLDVTMALSRYFQVDRGVLGTDPTVLDEYSAIIIADPQERFSETDKYILDRYVQNGGNILWVVNGVRFSTEILGENGFTPVIALDLNLTDLWFRHGIRITPALVQDLQCLPIPVDVSAPGQEPNYQPMPWYYAPLLLTSQASPITKGVAQISSSFVSPIEAVGGEDGLRKEVLVASSQASRIIGTPAEVDLGDMNPDMESFRYQLLPVGVSVEGQFESLFKHRMVPEGITETTTTTTTQTARQVWLASGSIIRNEWQQGQALPAGYDRYSRMQFGNRDLIVNILLWMTDSEGLIQLRNKEVALRLLNNKRAAENHNTIQAISTIVPVAILALIGLCFILIRKRKYTK